MGRHLGQRRAARPGSRPTRVAALGSLVVGLACSVVLAVSAPAMADDDSQPVLPRLPNGQQASPPQQAREVTDGARSERGRTSRTSERSDSGTKRERAEKDDRNGSDDKSEKGRKDTAPEDNDSGSDSDNGNDGNDDSDGKTPKAPADPNAVAGTPCTKAARACVELSSQRAWLIDPTGKVTTGPVPVSSGGPGEETPVGTFNVHLKDKNHFSKESKLPNGTPAPMPNSVFFTTTGVAFHGGSVTRASAGCVHLNDADALTFFNVLKVGDQVQVH